METLSGEIVLNIPARQAWNIFMDEKALNKVNPNMISSYKLIQGNGGEGSICQYKAGVGVQDIVNETTQKIVKVETGRSLTYEMISGDFKAVYDPFRATYTFSPIGDEKCIAKIKIEFKKKSQASLPLDRAIEACLGFYKSIEAYVQNNLVAN